MSISLDPQDWDALRQLAHRMLDDMLTRLQHIGEEPVWRKPPTSVHEALQQPLPLHSQPAEAVYEQFLQHIFPYPKGNIHPRFWSWVQGGGTPLTVLAELLAATMNPNVAIGDHAAMYVEQQVIDWCKEMLGFAPEGSGVLLSGATMANFTALSVARFAHHPGNVRRSGQSAPLRLYASVEAHNCIQKAIELLGLGSDALRKVPVDADFRMRIDALEQLIAEDRAAGFLPFCVVGTAGTVNTAAIDPLAEIQAVCQREGLWFHVDGAFGAWAKLVPAYQTILQPIETADSLAFDLHKWGWLPYDIGCVLIKNKEIHRATFATEANYLLTHERGLSAGPEPIGNFGLELSRGFRALKAWMLFQEQGRDRLAALVQQNIEQVFYLQSLIQKSQHLEMLAPVSLNIACFRARPPHLQSPESLNAYNKELLMQLQEAGIAAPSYTYLDGNYAIRVAHVNHRSRNEDFEAMVDWLEEKLNEILSPKG